MNINAIKVCKLKDICAIMYDLLYWMKKYLKKKIILRIFAGPKRGRPT